MTEIDKRKIFIVDTSVLLYDMNSIHSFPGNDVVIPLIVLDEIDRFKEKPGILGESARYINRFLDSLRKKGNLHDGVMLDNDQSIRVETSHSEEVPNSLDLRSGDNVIIGVAMHLKSIKDSDVIVITKDINFRVKCDALKINSEDYYKDRIITEDEAVYTGQRRVEIFSPDVINKFYEKGSISCEDVSVSLNPNEFFVGKHGNTSMIGVEKNGKISHLETRIEQMCSVNARNKEQKFALELLSRSDIPLVTLTGKAGSGKTFLTLMAALSGLQEKRYERLVITRTLQAVGKDIGYLPGDVNDKMDPWMGAITDNVRHAFKDLTYFSLMKEKGIIEITPLAFIRGRTFNNTFLIVDEAQNSTIHELKTVITRVGEGSKIVLLGDIEQIDTPYIDSFSNGLTVVIEKLKEEKLTGHVTLMKGERSELATLASKVI
jgi:PhoH-like ATPase